MQLYLYEHLRISKLTNPQHWRKIQYRCRCIYTRMQPYTSTSKWLRRQILKIHEVTIADVLLSNALYLLSRKAELSLFRRKKKLEKQWRMPRETVKTSLRKWREPATFPGQRLYVVFQPEQWKRSCQQRHRRVCPGHSYRTPIFMFGRDVASTI